MIRQIGLLTKLEMYNFWGINVLLHTADKKAKRKAILMTVIYGLVGFIHQTKRQNAKAYLWPLPMFLWQWL